MTAGPAARAVEDADMDAAASLLDRFFREEGFSLPVEGMRARLAAYRRRDGNAAFVAVDEGGDAMVGVATIATGFSLEYGGVAEIEDLYVVPDRRGGGVGRALVETACAWAADRGCSAVLVTVTPEGQDAHDLIAYYAALGFADDGRRILERRLT